MDEEELAALNEQLAGARAEIERLQANAAASAADAEAGSAALRERLEATTAAAEQEAAGLRAQIEESAQRESIALARYRELVVRGEPAVPAELITGDSIEAIDASLEAARATVGRIRAQLEAQARTARVPAGAPPRSGPDLSAMTPEQKIRYGLSQSRAG